MATLKGPNAILYWCKENTKDYPVDVPDFGQSWKDGLGMKTNYLVQDESKYTNGLTAKKQKNFFNCLILIFSVQLMVNIL